MGAASNVVNVLYHTETTDGADDQTTSSIEMCRLTTSGKFGDYVMLTTSNSVVVINGRQLTTECQWNDVRQLTGAAVWVEASRL